MKKKPCQVNNEISLPLSVSMGSSIYCYTGPEETDPKKTQDIYEALTKEADDNMYIEKKPKQLAREKLKT